MAKKKFFKSKGETRAAFMFLSPHQDVVDAVSHSMASIWFCESNSDGGSNNKYTTPRYGEFRCMKGTSGTNGWSSKKVAILIRGYAENGYNTMVFNQRCRTCDQLGTLSLDEKSYVERVAYRIQKWAGVQVGQPYYGSKGGKPHSPSATFGQYGICDPEVPVSMNTKEVDFSNEELVSIMIGLTIIWTFAGTVSIKPCPPPGPIHLNSNAYHILATTAWIGALPDKTAVSTAYVIPK
ncbi:hypothetical protein LTR41_011643 [Exophiala xenobiotica]|nr:hypothetical protein LTR41_011643 [Exophiala xenobiotica]KAK5550472.1 hypothetical protein LTR46_011524 [Exophiala xenobiotica]